MYRMLEDPVTALVLDGARLALEVMDEVGGGVTRLGRSPGLGVILVGEDPASSIYVRRKLARAREVGFLTVECRLPTDAGEKRIVAEVERFNRNPDIDGILVQLPLPAEVNTLRVMAAIDPDKDVDGLHALNAGLLSQGAAGLTPCTPLGCMRLIKTVCADLTGMNAVVLGSSNIVGKPMAAMLLSERATVTLAHVHTRDTPFICRGADILVTAVGRPGLVKADWIKPRAIVIDVGINRIETADGARAIVGDVDFEAARQVAGAITPVPGGVGPMTVACLMSNTLKAAQARTRAEAA
jgi:methylenetetrahydrofolate dehydrogenase (NADP+)/methenyltetrahydrofolate cyclohydrolase